MNLGDLKAFVAVAEAGSVNRAAARLNLTQPAVSRRVQNLEAAIGVVLSTAAPADDVALTKPAPEAPPFSCTGWAVQLESEMVPV